MDTDTDADTGPSIPSKLYKTTIVIWSEWDGSQAELRDLAFQAEEGDAYCSKMESVALTREQVMDDPDWDGSEFFHHSLEGDKWAARR